jgi:hypothetical protein
MRREILLAIAICLGTSGCQPEPAGVQESILGDWDFHEGKGSFMFDHELFGKGASPVFSFADGRFDFTHRWWDKTVADKVSGTYSTDTTKSPPEITFRYPERTITGIYSVSRALFE